MAQAVCFADVNFFAFVFLPALTRLWPHSAAGLRLAPERRAVRVVHPRVPPLHVGRVVVAGAAGHAAPALRTASAAS